MKRKWSIDPNDVSMGWNGSAFTVIHSKNWDRRNQIRSYEVTLRHVPTGVSITKRTAEKMLSRSEWKIELEKFRVELMKELEMKVAKHLRSSVDENLQPEGSWRGRVPRDRS